MVPGRHGEILLKTRIHLGTRRRRLVFVVFLRIFEDSQHFSDGLDTVDHLLSITWIIADEDDDDNNNDNNGKFDNDDADADADDEYLLLNKVEAHGNHGDAKEEIERAEGDSFLAVLHLLIWGQVPKTNGCQSDETEVGAEEERILREGIHWNRCFWIDITYGGFTPAQNFW